MTEEVRAPVEPGDVVLGRYVVDRVLAVGGMGTVVAARHAQLGHKVALKFLTARDPSAKESAVRESQGRFLVEAKAAARLKSEHVVHVSDVGTLESGTPFMVMEFLEGADLGDVLEAEGRLPLEVAVEYTLQACEGLAEAHAAKIVHRDLKPQNLFRTKRPDGTPLVKVLDFGVSKALSDDVRVQGTVTSTDAVFGSPLYMSPEQMASATRADQRSDIWSIGVVLYELLTGRLPFEAETMAGLCVAIANDAPRKLLADVPELPPELELVIERCLEKNPDHRYQNVGELAADLAIFAPAHARAHVDRIRRLVGVAVPASQPSFSSLSRVTAERKSGPRAARVDAETLGPTTGTDLAARMRPKRRRWVTWAAGGALLVGLGAAGATLVGRRTAPVEAASAEARAVPARSAPAATPLSAAEAPAAAPAPSASEARVLATAPTPAPVATHKKPSPRPAGSSPPAPSASIIVGISHDRK